MKGKDFSYYVYYRVREPALAKSHVERLLDQVQRRTGIRGRLLVSRTEPGMWMEVYEGVAHAPDFERELTRCVGEIDFSSILAPRASRKLECFHDSCV